MHKSFFTPGPSITVGALRALALTSGASTAIHRDPLYLWALDRDPQRRVGLVSGGGAGHEPMHAGFIGRGGLDAAVPGEVFTSPHSRQIYAASSRVARDGGVLHIVKNYTGDRINFAVAAERLQADGIEVAEVIIEDDLGSQGQAVGRRGTGATMIVEKVLGAAADDGLPLAELAELGTAVAQASRTVAVAHRAQTSPHTGEPAFEVPDGKLEYGVGIHGETAREQIDQPELADLVSRMVTEILDNIRVDDAGVIALVNGLGAVSELELGHVLSQVGANLESAGVRLRSAVQGTYVSALDMGGFSITLTAVSDSWFPYWLAPHHTAALPHPTEIDQIVDEQPDSNQAETASPSAWLTAVTDSISALRDPLDQLDQRAGDGDVGSNLAGAMASAKARARGADTSLVTDLSTMAEAFLEDVGGSSGPLFGLVFQSLANALKQKDGEDPAVALAQGVRDAADTVTRVGGAKPGDRTIIDALVPAGVDEQGNERQALDRNAVAAALAGAAATQEMVGKRGRSSYLGDRVLGVPDPGAIAMAAVLLVIVEQLEGGKDHASRETLGELIKI